MKSTQEITHDTYENPAVVQKYIEANTNNKKLEIYMEEVSHLIKGKNLIDMGCGPGHDSYFFAGLGFNVIGVDYSSEMIKQANIFKIIDNKPKFEQLDMREVGNRFEKDQFDAAWINSSLIHIQEQDVPNVLEGVRKIVKNGGKVFIFLKSGEQGPQFIKENKYIEGIEREFIFWEKDKFINLAKEYNFVLENLIEEAHGITNGKTTHWINFTFEIVK